MKISIVTPCKNAAKTIQATMDSVLGQGYADLEYIVLDGGSSDGTIDIIQRYHDRLSYWATEPDKGVYDALNKGFSRATGEIFAWVNAGDCYLPWTFHVVSEVFAEYPRVAWITGNQSSWKRGFLRYANGFALPREIIGLGLTWPDAGYRSVQQESCFWRRSLWEDTAPFPSDIKLAGDFWLWVQFSKRTELVGVDAVLGGFAHHQGQLSRRSRSQYREEVGEIRRAIYQDLGEIFKFKFLITCFISRFVVANTIRQHIVRALLGRGYVDWEKMYLTPDEEWEIRTETAEIPIQRLSLRPRVKSCPRTR